MKKSMYSLFAALLTVCLLAMLPSALAEEDVVSKAVEDSETAAPVELSGDDESEPAEALPGEASELPLPGEEYDASDEEAEVFVKDGQPNVVLDRDKRVTFPTGTVFSITTDKKVLVYKVANRNIATVASGIVTVRRVGVTTIKTVFEDGHSRVLTLNATANPKVPTGITIQEPASHNLDLRNTLTLKYKMKPDTAEGDVIWSSSDESIATVENGVVTPVKLGKVKIRVTAVLSSYTDEVSLNIVDRSTPTSIEIVNTRSNNLDIANTLRLTCRIRPDEAEKAVRWVSSDESVATVADGVVTPRRTGKVTISVIAEKGGKSDRITLNIIDKTMPTHIALTGLTGRLKITQTRQLGYRLFPATARSSVTWSSSNTSVATVSSSGIVTPHRAGTTRITVTANRSGKSDSFTLSVYDNTIPTGIRLKVSNPCVLDLSQWVQAGYTLLPGSASSAVTWKSNNPKVASVNSSTGRVTAHAVGTATITATTVRGGRKASYKVKVVDKHAPASIKFNEAKPLRLRVGKTWSLRYTVYSGYKGWKPRMNVTFTSNNSSVVWVTDSRKGTIKAMKPGTATITVRTDNGKTARITVVVSK